MEREVNVPEFEFLWENGPRLRLDGEAFSLSTDSVLLSGFVPDKNWQRIIDLGCGAGVLPVLLSHRFPRAAVCGIELQEASAALCRENMKINGFDESGIIAGDIRNHRTLFGAGEFDLCVSNPPYFAMGSGYEAPRDSRAAARGERFCTLLDICEAAKYLLRWGGSFALVHRPERLSELFCAMTDCLIEPKRLRMVQHKAASAPGLVLVEGRRGGKPGLSVEKPLILANDDGTDSEEIKELYHRQS